MAKRDTFLLRMDPAVMEALRRWSEDELRSMNGQIEFLLRRALIQSGRMEASNSKNSLSTGESKPKHDGADNQ